MHQHPVRQKRNFNLAATGFKPVDHRRFRPCSIVFSGAKHILQQYPMNIRHARQTVARLCGKIDDIVADAVYLEFRSHIVVVERHGHPPQALSLLALQVAIYIHNIITKCN